MEINITTEKDESKVASSTGNITGIYDMSGGAYEYVMANMVDSSGAFYPSSSGTSWNGISSLENRYYHAYAYGTNYYTKDAYNRARLGDATAEVLGTDSNNTIIGAWKPGSGVTGVDSHFVVNTSAWFARGGGYALLSAGAFEFNGGNGASFNYYSFRSAIS